MESAKDRRDKKICAWRQSSSTFCSDTIAGASDNPMAFWGVCFFVMLNSRCMDIGAGSVSLRNKKSQTIREKVAGRAQGRK